MVWYSHLFRSFPQLVVIHTVKGFGLVNKAEVDSPCKWGTKFFPGNRFSLGEGSLRSGTQKENLGKGSTSWEFFLELIVPEEDQKIQSQVNRCYKSK